MSLLLYWCVFVTRFEQTPKAGHMAHAAIVAAIVTNSSRLPAANGHVSKRGHTALSSETAGCCHNQLPHGNCRHLY